jgi:signal transduction histidine kinase
LLNTSRIDLGNFLVEPEEVDVAEFTKEVAGELDQKFEDRKIKYYGKYEDVGVLPIDKKLYHILIENLLTNAIKYTELEGRVDLELSKNSDGLMIKVSDTGYGIPDDQKHKIFSKLFRADNVKAKDTDGTGLGLYLVKSIVDYIGGKIWFDSEENKGTTFYIVLPGDGMKPKQGSKTLTTKTN